jgi:hypothetical protein
MGHASVVITLDPYGHLAPGNEAEAAAMLDALLRRATSQSPLAVGAAGTNAENFSEQCNAAS